MPALSRAFDPATLPPLRDVIARYGLGARKSLGQHFLLDSNLTGRIARAAGNLADTTVIEIGPGPGGLTRALLATEAVAIVAVERDHRCVDALGEVVEAASGRLRLIHGDALLQDWRSLAPPPRAVVANLPYNIATPLLIGWLQDIEAFAGLTVMLQREVAQRLTAVPGTKAYGRLSVITQWVAGVDTMLHVPARAFVPPPKVDSTVVRLMPLSARHPARWHDIERVTAAAFGQRRKMLRQSLRSLGDAAALVRSAGLLPTMRAEDVDVAGFAALARALADQSSS